MSDAPRWKASQPSSFTRFYDRNNEDILLDIKDHRALEEASHYQRPSQLNTTVISNYSTEELNSNVSYKQRSNCTSSSLPTTMSTQPETSYVYIPNLIGGQMLRIPVLPINDSLEEETFVPETSDFTIDTAALPIPTRHASSTPSDISAVESVEEAE